MTARILIKREVPKGKEGALLPLLTELRTLAMAQPGYISGETLRNMDNPQDFLVISTWHSVDDWNAWISSRERNELQKKIDTLLGQKTEYGIYYHG
jgi:heme-degrading monooxygenase HmoA